MCDTPLPRAHPHAQTQRLPYAGQKVLPPSSAVIALMPSPDEEYVPSTPATWSASGTCYGGGQGTCAEARHEEQAQPAHGPVTLQQAVANSIQGTAFASGSSDNLAVVVLDISPRTRLRTQSAQAAASFSSKSAARQVGGISSQGQHEAASGQLREADVTGPTQAESDDKFACLASESDLLTDAQQPMSSHREDLSLHALPAVAFDLQISNLPDLPGVTLWQDSSQVTLGTVIGEADSPFHYRLLDQVAELPRYSDHLHASWTGLPILSSMSLWLQSRWPSFATSHCLMNSDHADEEACQNQLWPQDYSSAGSRHTGSSQLMLSPGSMLQLFHWDKEVSTSCLSGPGDGTLCVDEGLICTSAICNGMEYSDDPEWLSSTALAVVQTLIAMPADTEDSHWEDTSPTLPANRIYDDSQGVKLAANSSQLQPVRLRRPGLPQGGGVHSSGEWQKYEKGRNFARGSFGEVWHAEQASVGGLASQKPVYTIISLFLL